MKKIERIKERLRAVSLLQKAKKHETYKDLSEKTGIPAPSLSRYVMGHVIPSYERAKDLIELFQPEVTLKKEIYRRVDFGREYFNIYPALFDPNLLQRIAEHAKEKFIDLKPERILSVAIDGIPLTVMIANEFNTPYVYAKRSKEVGVQEFYEQEYPGSAGILKTIYLPKECVKQNENILLVDDIIRTGETMKALIKLTLRAKAKISGVFSIVSFKESKKELESEDFPIVSLVELSQ